MNVENGSTFHDYCVDIPWQKQNGGILHESGGWINHFFQAIRAFLRGLEEDSPWMKDAPRILNDGLFEIVNEYKAPKKVQRTKYRDLYNANEELQKKARDARVNVKN